ncbi:MAG TPA: hypothetical protein VLU25_06610 [Acidobacteriota bacterium]|nr:hypothetical protein [Acidobacteriota bacterium]
MVLAILAGCSSGAASSTGAESGDLRDLTEIDQLAATFNEGRGKPRVVLLLSPT